MKSETQVRLKRVGTSLFIALIVLLIIFSNPGQSWKEITSELMLIVHIIIAIGIMYLIFFSRLTSKYTYIGAIWGLLSWIIAFLSSDLKDGVGVFEYFGGILITLPTYIPWSLIGLLPLRTAAIVLLLGTVIPFFPIIIGALIGSIIGFAIEKYRMLRPSK
jgi:hypothetical protein